MQRGDAWAAVADRLGERYPSVCSTIASTTSRSACARSPAAGDGAVRLLDGRADRAACGAADPGRWPALVLVGVAPGVEDPAARGRAEPTRSSRPGSSAADRGGRGRWERQPVFADQPRRSSRPSARGGSPTSRPSSPRCCALPARARCRPVWDRLPELEMPVLCLAGELDEKYARRGRAHGRAGASRARRALVAIAGTPAHAPQLEAVGLTTARRGSRLRRLPGASSL